MPVACAIHIIITACEHLSRHPTAIPRDLSPRTILVGSNGSITVATPTNPSSDTGRRFSYLSPEVASGLEFDVRSDVFMLGAILWELLSGVRLFQGDTDYQTVELVRAARVPADSSIEPTLDAVVRTALARRPEERHPDPPAFAVALTHYLTSHSLEPSPRDIADLVLEATPASPGD